MKTERGKTDSAKTPDAVLQATEDDMDFLEISQFLPLVCVMRTSGHTYPEKMWISILHSPVCPCLSREQGCGSAQAPLEQCQQQQFQVSDLLGASYHYSLLEWHGRLYSHSKQLVYFRD